MAADEPGSGGVACAMRIETEQEDDGRWLADVLDLPGVLAYGTSPAEAVARVEALELRVLVHKVR